MYIENLVRKVLWISFFLKTTKGSFTKKREQKQKTRGA